MNAFALNYRKNKLSAMLAEPLDPALRDQVEYELEEVTAELHALQFPVELARDADGKPHVIMPLALTPRADIDDIRRFSARALNILRNCA